MWKNVFAYQRIGICFSAWIQIFFDIMLNYIQHVGFDPFCSFVNKKIKEHPLWVPEVILSSGASVLFIYCMRKFHITDLFVCPQKILLILLNCDELCVIRFLFYRRTHNKCKNLPFDPLKSARCKLKMMLFVWTRIYVIFSINKREIFFIILCLVLGVKEDFAIKVAQKPHLIVLFIPNSFLKLSWKQ